MVGFVDKEGRWLPEIEWPRINYFDMNLPSERLSLKVARQLNVDRGGFESGLGIGELVEELLSAESAFANAVFQQVFGDNVPTQSWVGDMGGFIREQRGIATNLYQMLGIASGKRHADELLKTVKSQAEGQARELLGRGGHG